MKRSDEVPGGERPGLAQTSRLFWLLSLSVVAGFIAAALRMPLAWMIGPMIIAAVLSIAGLAPRLHPSVRGAGQMIVAAAVGLHFTPVALAETLPNLHIMVVTALVTTIAGCGTAFIIVRLVPSHPATAFFACVPGGPAEMAQLAEQRGGNGSLVAAAQSLRIASIVLVIPAILLLLTGGDLSVGGGQGHDVVGPLGLLAVLFIAVAFAVLFHRSGITSPLFLGPLAASAIFAAAGIYDFEFPAPVIYAGQLLLGASLGLSFSRQMLRQAPHFMAVCLLMTGLLMAACAVVGWVLSVLTGWSLATMVLATAPGSVTEMSITAETLGLSVTGVTAFHIVRLFVMLPLTPFLFRLTLRRLNKR